MRKQQMLHDIRRTSRLRDRAGIRLLVLLAMSALSVVACASYEKNVILTYQAARQGDGASGEVLLARTLVEPPLPKLPGGRVVLGTVRGTVTQIVTPDDVARWVDAAMLDELFGAGFDVRTVSAFPENTRKGIHTRVRRVSSNQQSDGIILRTTTEIDLAAEIWRDGHLAKTLTVNIIDQNEGVDRSGVVVSNSLRAALESALRQLMPAIVENLG